MIGDRHLRLGAERLLRGEGRFVADLSVPGMLEAAVVRSRHAHARLMSVEMQRALALPGVHAVLTAADVAAAAIISPRIPVPDGVARYLQPAIARDVVRYVGEPVTVVIADNRYIAEDALELIDVVYEPLPVCASAERALAPDAPRLFPGTDSNNVAVLRMRVGDADQALAGSTLVVAERFHHPRQTAVALEPRGLLAVPPSAAGGELHLLGATKCIHTNRHLLAAMLGVPAGTLRLTEVDVGGGFGVRGEIYPEDILVPLAALRLGRPIRWIEERRESFQADNHARETTIAVEIGFDADGRIQGIRAIIHADVGAYVRTVGLAPGEFAAAHLPGPYRVPHYACDVWNVVTNKTPVGTLRSPGRPEVNFARERVMDVAARRLGLDPAEIRRRNLIRAEDMPWDSGVVSLGAPMVYDSGDFPALFETLLKRVDYPAVRAEQQRCRIEGVRRGVGLALYVEKTGLGPFETVHLEARPDGRFVLDTGAASMGPGLETVLAQIVGEHLGVAPGRIEVRHTDTQAIESGVGTYASRGTVTAGNAARMAAAKLIDEARSRLPRQVGLSTDDVTYQAGVLWCQGRSVSLTELAAAGRLAAAGSFEVTKATYAGGGVAVMVDVDIDTGRVHLRRVVLGADVGRAVNPALVEAQLVGGAVFGIGNAVQEYLAYDEQGQLQTATLLDYGLPLAADIPDVEAFYQEITAHTNPLGLRGVGESGNPGLGAAIANAVCDALDDLPLSLSGLPVTSDRVRAAILRARCRA